MFNEIDLIQPWAFFLDAKHQTLFALPSHLAASMGAWAHHWQVTFPIFYRRQ
jgi:hypothetical protein